MARTMCEWKKDDYEEKFDKLRSIVSQPTHVCTRCGRVANDPERLCRPKPLGTEGTRG